MVTIEECCVMCYNYMIFFLLIPRISNENIPINVNMNNSQSISVELEYNLYDYSLRQT